MDAPAEPCVGKLDMYSRDIMFLIIHNIVANKERAHRFCIKYVQNLPPYSRTAIALCSVGLTSIESEIDYKKLQFFSQLCRLPCKYIAKQIFVNRLLRYVNNDKQTQGFIPDIYRIIVKYNLQNVLQTYMHTSCFPTKYEWKRILKHKIYEYDFNLYNEQLSTIIEGGQSSYMFYMLKPCAIWQLCIRHPNMKLKCKTAMIALSKLFSFCQISTCKKCKTLTENIVEHTINVCSTNNDIRNNLWTAIYESVGYAGFLKFMLKSQKDQIVDIISGFKLYLQDDDNVILYKMVNIIHKMFN